MYKQLRTLPSLAACVVQRRGPCPRRTAQARFPCRLGASSLLRRLAWREASRAQPAFYHRELCVSTVCVTQHDNNNNSVCERNRGATFYLLSSVHEFDAGRKGLVKGARRPM